uniref:DPH4-like protein n=1 Tax=Aegilops tauschii TaxID=37682 RepID=R7W8B6_AEGTA
MTASSLEQLRRRLREGAYLWKTTAFRCFHRCQQQRKLLQMLQGSGISNQKTLYEVLSVPEDATYDEIRAAYKCAALNTHPDKAQATVESSVCTGEQHGFFGVQKAWETLRYPKCRAEYDKQLQSSRQSIDIIASDIEIEDMTVESSDDGVELLYACRCGDYFSITACELGEMGISVILNEMRNREMRKRSSRCSVDSPTLSGAFAWSFTPLHPRSSIEKVSCTEEEKEAASDSDNESEAFFSVKSFFTRSTSRAATVASSTDMDPPATWEGLRGCEGGPFGLCRRPAVPPLPSTPADSWKWRKRSRNLAEHSPAPAYSLKITTS